MKNLKLLFGAFIVLFAFSTLTSCEDNSQIIKIEDENSTQQEQLQDFQASNKDEEPDRDDEE